MSRRLAENETKFPATATTTKSPTATVDVRDAIEAEKKAALAELTSQVATLSIDIAEKVVREELSNKGKQEELVASMLDEAKLN